MGRSAAREDNGANLNKLVYNFIKNIVFLEQTKNMNMTPNRSLALSLGLKSLMRADLLRDIDSAFPFSLIEARQNHPGAKPSRDRVYNTENTLMTMVLSALGPDKSLKQAVNVFKGVFELKGGQMRDMEASRLRQEKEDAAAAKRLGRPRLYKTCLAKSKTCPVSDNTAAFAKARIKLDKGLVREVFDHSAGFEGAPAGTWHGMYVLITDGTYFQMQDSENLRKKYYVREGDGAYPQGLLQCVIGQGDGRVRDFRIGTRHQSELELITPMLAGLPAGGLLLADDLYSTYAVFCLVRQRSGHIIVPGKRERAYKTVKKLADGDEIVEIKKTKCPPWLDKAIWEKFDDTLLMRRVSCAAPENDQKEYVLYTTILDEKIKKEEVILKYSTRWDIEITIREIKTIMDINVARGKTEDMVFKEITVALTAYNMVRKIIGKSVAGTDFSPQSSFVQKCFEVDQDLLIDKKGRRYRRRSPGRYGKAVGANREADNQAAAGEKIPAKGKVREIPKI